MSAGDARFVGGGWGVSPYYRHAEPPTIEYDYSASDGINIDKRVTYHLIGLAKYVAQICGQFRRYNNALSAPVVGASGAAESLSLGSGWELADVATAQASERILQRVDIVFRKSVPLVFEFLPPDYSISATGGGASLYYKTTLLERWDSGQADDNSGLSITPSIMRRTYTTRTTVSAPTYAGGASTPAPTSWARTSDVTYVPNPATIPPPPSYVPWSSAPEVTPANPILTPSAPTTQAPGGEMALPIAIHYSYRLQPVYAPGVVTPPDTTDRTYESTYTRAAVAAFELRCCGVLMSRLVIDSDFDAPASGVSVPREIVDSNNGWAVWFDSDAHRLRLIAGFARGRSGAEEVIRGGSPVLAYVWREWVIS